jgi:hypothetical protein
VRSSVLLDAGELAEGAADETIEGPVEREDGPVRGDELEELAAVGPGIVGKAKLEVGGGILVLDEEEPLADGRLEALEAAEIDAGLGEVVDRGPPLQGLLVGKVVNGLEFEEAGHGEEIRDEAVDVAVEAIP